VLEPLLGPADEDQLGDPEPDAHDRQQSSFTALHLLPGSALPIKRFT